MSDFEDGPDKVPQDGIEAGPEAAVVPHAEQIEHYLGTLGGLVRTLEEFVEDKLVPRLEWLELNAGRGHFQSKHQESLRRFRDRLNSLADLLRENDGTGRDG